MQHARAETDGQPRGPTIRAGDDQLDLVIEVATWFYVHGWSQINIAKALRIDPSTVSRYLKRAREESIVRVEIRRPTNPETDFARRLAEHTGVGRAIVAQDSDHPIESVAAAAAAHLDGLLRNGSHVAISWGRTLAAMVRHLPPGSVAGLDISQLAGGLDESTPDIQGHEVVRSLGNTYPGSRMRYLHAPAIVEGRSTADAIKRERTVAAALTAAASSEIALVGIGSMDDEATLARGGHVSTADRQRLVESGAVGNMNTRFFDAKGQPVGDLDQRTIAITWEQLRAVPTVIAVAAGSHKADAIAAALRSGCIDVLVTDESVAHRLLDGTDVGTKLPGGTPSTPPNSDGRDHQLHP